MNELNTAAASFIKVYDRHYDETQSCLLKCGQVTAEIEDLKKWRCAVLVGICFYEIFVAFLSIKAYSVGATSVLEVFTAAVALPALFYYNSTENRRTCVETVDVCIKQFKCTVSLLNIELEEVKRLCEKLRGGLGRADRVRLMRLEQGVLEVFVLTEELSPRASADTVSRVWEEHSRALAELHDMKVRLSFYTASW